MSETNPNVPSPPIEGAGGGHLVGVDIGGTKIEAALVGPDGAIASTARVPARRGGMNVVEDVVSLVRNIAGERLPDVTHVGIGTPGQVEPSTGMVRHVVNLDIESLDLGPQVRSALGIPTHVENDVNAAVMGGASLMGMSLNGVAPVGAAHANPVPKDGRKDGGDTVVLLNFGTGLAAGIIIAGGLHHGYAGAAGEIGHIPVDPNRFDCPCGQRGCLETVCSGAAVDKLWPTPNGVASMPDLIMQASQGEVEACRTLGIIRHAIGDAIQIVAQSIDPDLIILGGGMAKTGAPLLAVIADEIDRREGVCPFLKGLRLMDRVRLAPMDKPLGALGAALAAAVYS